MFLFCCINFVPLAIETSSNITSIIIKHTDTQLNKRKEEKSKNNIKFPFQRNEREIYKCIRLLYAYTRSVFIIMICWIS